MEVKGLADWPQTLPKISSSPHLQPSTQVSPAMSLYVKENDAASRASMLEAMQRRPTAQETLRRSSQWTSQVVRCHSVQCHSSHERVLSVVDRRTSFGASPLLSWSGCLRYVERNNKKNILFKCLREENKIKKKGKV